MPVNKYFVILIDEILIFEVVRDEKNGKSRKIKKILCTEGNKEANHSVTYLVPALLRHLF
jgi:hypothetical protein